MTAMPRSDSSVSTQRIFVAVLVGVGLLIALSFPLALHYDDKVDRQRSGYNDAATVVRMQEVLLTQDKKPVAFDIGPGESVKIGHDTFTAGPGDHVVSEVNDQGLCVRVTNPDTRAWTYDSADSEHPYDDISRGACG